MRVQNSPNLVLSSPKQKNLSLKRSPAKINTYLMDFQFVKNPKDKLVLLYKK